LSILPSLHRTINVEYNQLDPLLRDNGFPNGDVNDPNTGFSPFPGNINQLLFMAEPYAAALEECKGLMPEFVNPKYKDDSKTVFKKPTRLECMMQDFPSVLQGTDAQRVAFTSISADLCFSPVKNATEDGVKLQADGTHPGCAASGEADHYGACRKILRSIGVQVEDRAPETYKGISVVLGPEIVIAPGSMCCPGEYADVFPTPEKVHITARSSLVILGTGKLTIESLNLDGALVINCEEGADAVVSNLNITNEGWVREPVANTGKEIIDMRGYKLIMKKTAELNYKKKDDCVIL
jgi:UDP-sugar pyrophosphorylase